MSSPRAWSRGLTRAAEAADATGFVPIDPPAYATKRELRVDGWLAAARAEVCVSLEVAPELALPSRIMKGCAATRSSHGAERLGECLGGLAQDASRPARSSQFAADFPLKS